MRCPKLNFTRIFTSIAIVSIAILIFSQIFTPAQAAIGINRQINFQGKLVNNPAATNVTDTNYSIVFTLYDNASGANTVLWTETQPSVPTVDGIFRVALGSVTPFPANFNFNWSGLYLGIKVGADSEMTPRIQMAAVPFAFNAEKVAGLTVQDTSGNASTSGTLQIANAKTVSFADAFTTSGAFPLTLTTTASTNVTLPTTGTLLTNTAAANQTLTSTQTSGNVLSIADTSGTGTLAGISFNLNGSGTTYDLLGTGSTWSITKAGVLSVVSCSGCGGVGSTNYWGLSNGNGVTTGGLLYGGNLTTDFAIGGASTASALFSFSGVLTGQTIASVSGNLIVMPNNGWGGQLGIGTTNPQGVLDILGKFRVTNTGQLDLIGNLSSDIDTLTATKLTIAGVNANQIVLGNNTVSTLTFNVDGGGPGHFVFQKEGAAYTCSGTDKLTLNGSGQLICSTDVSGGGGGGGGFTELLGAIVPLNSTEDFLIGGQSTASAKFAVLEVNTGQTIASVSGNFIVMPQNGWGGQVGIGTTTPTAGFSLDNRGLSAFGNQQAQALGGNKILYVNNKTTDINSDNFAIGGSVEANPSADTSKLYYGAFFSSFSSTGNVQNFTGRLVGFQGQVTHNGTGTLAQARGFAGFVFNAAGGTITDSFAGRFGNTNSSTGQMTNAYGVYVVGGANSGGGALLNNYGLYVEDQSLAGSTSNYSIYAAGGGSHNYLAGNLGIGSTAVGNAQFVVNQTNFAGTGDIFAASSSGTTRFMLANTGAITASFYNTCTLKTDSTGLVTCASDDPGMFTNVLGANVAKNSTADFLFGSQASASARFRLIANNLGAGTLGVASISGQTSFAALVVDNSIGDLFTASASGATRFVIAQNGTVTIGNSTDGLVFSPTNSGPTYSGTARPSKTITLSPEYTGAILTASNSATTNGNMTSDASSSANFRTYYEWSSTQASLQDYTVAVRVTLPNDFSAWATSNAMTIDFDTATTNAPQNKFDLLVYNPSASVSIPVMIATGNVSSVGKTWQTLTIPSSRFTGSTAWNTAGQTATIYLKMYAGSPAYVQIGDIGLNYLSKF